MFDPFMRKSKAENWRDRQHVSEICIHGRCNGEEKANS